MKLGLALSALLVVSLSGGALAAPLSCPASASATAVLPPSEFSSVAAIDNVVDRAAMVSRMVAQLGTRGMVPSGVVDSLVSAYCPVIAANGSLSDKQKTANVRDFAAAVVRAAYGFQDAEEVIIDVALPPSVMSAINDRAKQDQTTAQSWAATAITNAVKAPR